MTSAQKGERVKKCSKFADKRYKCCGQRGRGGQKAKTFCGYVIYGSPLVGHSSYIAWRTCTQACAVVGCEQDLYVGDLGAFTYDVRKSGTIFTLVHICLLFPHPKFPTPFGRPMSNFAKPPLAK